MCCGKDSDVILLRRTKTIQTTQQDYQDHHGNKEKADFYTTSNGFRRKVLVAKLNVSL